MNTWIHRHSQLLTIGIGMAGLLVLAIYFFVERTAYIDSATQIFEMINNQGFAIFVERYSMVVNQAPVVLAIRLEWSLKSVMMIYSLTPILIALGTAWIVHSGFKNTGLALVLALMPLAMRDMFVHAISETFLAMCYSALFAAWIMRPQAGKRPLLEFLVLPILVALNYFIHPVSLFMLVFSLGYVLLLQQFKNWKYVGLVTLLVLAVYMYKFFFPSTAHEDGFFSGLKNFRETLPRFFELPSVLFVVRHFFRLYMYVGIPFLGVVAFYIYQKCWLHLMFYVGFACFFLIITGLVYYKGDSALALESRYLPYIFFVFLPLATEVLPALPKWKPFILGGLMVFLGISLLGLHRVVKRNFTGRKEYIECLAQNPEWHGHTKVVFEPNIIPSEKLANHWALSMESLLITALKNPESPKTFFIRPENEQLSSDVFTQGNSFLLTSWWMYFSAQDLNASYFKLKEQPYLAVYSPTFNAVCP